MTNGKVGSAPAESKSPQEEELQGGGLDLMPEQQERAFSDTPVCWVPPEGAAGA